MDFKHIAYSCVIIIARIVTATVGFVMLHVISDVYYDVSLNSIVDFCLQRRDRGRCAKFSTSTV